MLSDTEFLGREVQKRSVYLEESGTWIEYPAYILCPADTAEEQMQCQKYEPGDTNTWQCRHCDNGRSDICMADNQ